MVRGRKPSVRYWDSVGGYCCWIKGERHILAKGDDDAPTGKTYLEAHAKFKKLIELEANIGTNDYLVSSLLNQYRTFLRETRKSGAPGIFESLARGFSEQFGHLRVCDLRPHMFDEWIREQKKWNATSKAHAGNLILGAISWAEKKGFIEKDQLKGRVELPSPVLRGREAKLSEELMDLMISESKMNQHKSSEFAEFMWALRVTGCRPGELRHAEAFNYMDGKLVFRWNATRGYLWKNAAKTQRDRIIFLTPDLQEHIEGLVRRNPTGRIFRTPRNASWSLQSLSNKLKWLLERPKIEDYCKQHDIAPRTIKLYNFRHSWACNYLDTTGDIFACALMMGTSVKMLQSRYFHMDEQKLHEKFLAYHRAISN